MTRAVGMLAFRFVGILGRQRGDATFGHYMAYARSSEDGVWRLFDDEDVTEVGSTFMRGGLLAFCECFLCGASSRHRRAVQVKRHHFVDIQGTCGKCSAKGQPSGSK